MVQVMIRLQNHGKRNHPYWYIVVQPKNKHFQGRYIERVGIWAPRKTQTVDRHISLNSYKIKYWLSVGATPTNSVHRLLYFAGLMPRKPIPFGSASVYPTKTRPYSMQYFHKHRWGLQNPSTAKFHHYDKIKRMESILKTKLEMDNEVINEIVLPRELEVGRVDELISPNKLSGSRNYYTDMNTDEINSDDFDFYSRKRNFDIVSKKLNKYFDTKYSLYRGNDYKYHNYLRKLEKLSKHESLDYEGFKDYLEAVNQLSDSKNKALESIGQHYLNELLSKESLHKEIDELIRMAKASENNKKEENLKENSEEKIKEHQGKATEHFKQSAEKDTAAVLEALNTGFKLAAKEMFKVSPEESFMDKEFQDIKNLRIAKILIKLRQAVLMAEKRQEIIRGKEDPKIYKIKSTEKKGDATLNNSSFFTSIFENLTSSTPEDIPVFDNELMNKILAQHQNPENYDEMLFQNINNYLLSTETFNKFKPLLFNEEFYGAENLSTEEKNKILTNPNIYLLNNNIIDELIAALMDKLQKKYEMNEIYRDEEKDLNKFENEEEGLIKRRAEMESKFKELKKKYGNFNLMFDDYRGETEELRKDIREFKQEYENELEGKFDVKFKRDLRIERPPMTVGKYDTPEGVEAEQAREEKLEKIKEKITQEFIDMKKGLVKTENLESTQKEEEELDENDKKYVQALREQLRLKYLGPKLGIEEFIALPNDNRPFIDFEPFFRMMKYKYKKQTKHPLQDEILTLNKRKLRQNIIFAHSIQKSIAIPKARQIEMKERFQQYFGKYNSFMYPEGFRHYENFEMYQSVFPNKTMADYQTEINSLCDFDTFVLISYGLINHYKKIGLMALEFPEMFDRAEFLTFYMKSKNTEFITQTLKQAYKGFIQMFEERGTRFCLIDALEQTSAINLSETLIPQLKNILDREFEEDCKDGSAHNKFAYMKMPNLQERGEDMGISRMGPFMPINPLKAHKANPSFNTPLMMKKAKVRLTNARMRLYKGFCTVINRIGLDYNDKI